MAPEPSTQYPAPWWRLPRVLAAIAVVALHGTFIVFVLSSQSGPAALAPTPREMFFLFHPVAPRLPRRIEPPQTAPARSRPLFRYAPSTAITLPPPVENALAHSLFDCAPDNLARLAPDERKRCGALMAAIGFEAPYPGATPRDSALQSARWQADLSARRAPSQIDCAGTVPGPGANGGVAVTVDPLCAARHLIDHSDR
ncbi:MAG: hypothetical protein WDN01_21930 [Rhizomicrobium sp.]